MPTTNHKGPCKYRKEIFRKSKTPVYKCTLPGCPHFVYEALVVGRLSICNRCNEIYLVTKKTIRNKKMHCEDCTLGRDPVIPQSLNNQIEKILENKEDEG